MLPRAALSAILLFCAAVSSAAQNFIISDSLRGHVEYLCSDSLEGRRAGSDGERSAAEYVYKCFKDAGVVMLTPIEGQDFKITAPGGDIDSRNVVGVVEGYDPLLKHEYILVGAHLDNVGSVETTVDGQRVKRIFPGADDNASGVAALIELAKLVSSCDFHFRRSVLLVAFGASECGLAGSWYFANRAFPEMDKVKAAVILDMLGRGDDRSRFRVFSSYGKAQAASILEAVLDEPVVTPPTTFGGTVQNSDHMPFYEKGIPVFLFTTGMTHEYHTVGDTPQMVSYLGLERICNYVFYFLKTVSCRNDLSPVEEKAPVVFDDGGDTVFYPADCDKRAQFFHSDERHFLSAWVYKYLKYPQEAIDEGIQGKVTVTFVVEKNGKVSNVAIVKGVDPLLDEEVLRVVSASPDWIAAKIKGKAVRTRITLPVEFRLSSNYSIGLKGLNTKKKK